MTRHRVSTFGEAMLRLSVNEGERLEDAPAFHVHVAGSEANVAFALARVGLASSWASCLPQNALGRRVAATLKYGGVDLSGIHWVDDGRLGTYFVEFSSPPRPTYVVYDRRASAVAQATADLYDWDTILDATAFHVTGISFAISRSAAEVARRGLEEARARSLFVSFDVNYRQLLWSPEEAAATAREIAPLLDLFTCRAEDARQLFGLDGPPERMAVELREQLGAQTVVITNGATGAAGASAGGVVARPTYPVDIVDRIGAGDAFAAGLLWGVLEHGSLAEGLERGLAMAALKMTLRGDLFRLEAADVDALRAGHSREITR